MGIRTVGFEKVSRIVTPEEKSPKEKIAETKSSAKTLERDVNANALGKKSPVKPATSTKVAEQSEGKGTVTLKLRTPASMARLGDIKAAARKLKKQRKRRLFVRPTNKLLRNSIKATRRSFRIKENSRESENATVNTLPSRTSTRMCVRRNSRDGIPEAPLRTVELIKRPLELREPATKLLYLASLGLYPNIGDSDVTPVVVIKELTGSPGKKNGIHKSLELPLIPFYKRNGNVASSTPEKKSMADTKPMEKPSKQENRKSPPVTTAKQDAKKSESQETETMHLKNISAAISTVTQAMVVETSSKVTISQTKANNEPSKRKSPVDGIITTKPLQNSLDLTITPGKPVSITPTPTAIAQGAGKIQSNSKSLLKNNLSELTSGIPDNSFHRFPLPLDFVHSSLAKKEAGNSAHIPASTCNLTNAMNLIMSNITILPASENLNSRKRPSDAILSNTRVMEVFPTSTTNGLYSEPTNEKPPRKRQKKIQETKTLRHSLPTSITVNNVTAFPSQCQNQNSSFVQSTLPQNQNADEALNLCTKRNSEPPISVFNPPLPKLQNKSSSKSSAKGNSSGPRPLNLIIPRPPPLTKAPLEVANIANTNFSQNVQPVQTVKEKSQFKKPKKPRQSHNQRHQSSLSAQMPLLPPLTQHLGPAAEAAVHTKSLLKCMNGEENSCAREVGETIDSVKTMLARLQTSIGPAVNGVRLITIE